MSVAAKLAQGSKLYIAGSATEAEVCTAITAGYPTIIAITGHAGVANGDVVTFSGFTGADAALLNSLTGVVKNYATGASNDTFAVDINTVGKTITIDGSNSKATPTEWVQVKEIQSIRANSAQASEIPVTDLDSTGKEYKTGLLDNGTVAFEYFDLESDDGQEAVLTAFTNSTSNSYKLALTGGTNRTFTASVTKFGTIPDLSVDGVQTGSFELKISGAVVVS
jgi:hypothetical protein